MAQKPQIIDITKSYLPGDPNSFVQNLVNTDKEDGEEKALPVLPYEGYNFLPTAYGYKSYFGTNSYLDLPALTSRAQYILLYQLPNFKNRLIALCEDGIWIGVSDGDYNGWTHVVVDSYDPNTFEEWTWCVIENVLYMYKQGKSLVYKTGLGLLTLSLTVTPSVPAGSGTLVSNPTAYQTFTVTDSGNGSETDFTAGDTLFIYAVYVQGAYKSEYVLIGTLLVDSTTSVNVVLSGTPPIVTGLSVRLWIESDDDGTQYYGDYAIGSFPVDIVDYTGMTSSTLVADPATLYEENGTAAIPAVYPEAPWPEAKFLNGANNLLGQDAHNSTRASFDPFTVYLVNDLAITSFAPSFLNMAGQLGIFRAGLRLGFWDSSNSVSWSSNLDLSDFTPSLENLAGNTIFGYVIGRIVLCKGHGEGFIVYSTKSIVGVTFASSGNLLWDAKKILDSSGIATSKAVTCGSTDDEHFVYSTTGIYTIGKYNSLTGVYDEKNALPELYDYLRESRDPIALKIIQDRYIFFSLYNADYIYGRQSFYYGTVDPLLFDINWYTPSDAAPTGSSTILPDQMWEIIKNEMSGRSKTKRKDGEWVPRYTTTVDIMDDRCYSFWRSWVGEQSTRLPYDSYSTYLNTIPIELTSGDIATYLAPQRPLSPPDAHRYGRLRTATGIRAGWFMESDDKNNNEALIYGQESEWEGYIQRAKANKERLVSYIRVEETVNLPYTLNAYSANISGSPADAWETLLNRTATYPSGGATQTGTFFAHNNGNGTYTYTCVNIPYSVVIAFSTPIWNVNAWFPAPTSPKNYCYTGTITVPNTYPNPALVISNTGFWKYSLQTSNINALDNIVDINIGVLVTGEGNNLWLTTEGISDKAAKEVILRRTFNKAFSIVKHLVIVNSPPSITTTYVMEEVTGSYGYSQFRALVTHWDRVKFGLYGSYEILETVAAEAMTAKVWDSIYGTDRGTGRDQIWSYADYKAQAVTNLAEGKMSAYDVFPPDPNATPYLTIDGYDQNGITNAHSSFTLPGTTFVLQTGSIEASYPTYVGALVYDIQLKKWGKYKGDHKVLLETYPINSAENNTITYSDLGSNAAIFDAAGLIYLFDSEPLDSWIRYGKIGYQRLGMTWSGEIKVSMRYASDFRIQVDSSLTGKLLDMGLSQAGNFYNEIETTLLTDIAARWHSVKISGSYDLTGLEVRGTLAGRR